MPIRLSPLFFFWCISALVPVVVSGGTPVTCGSAVKLTHLESGGEYHLYSGGQNMNSGSGQQIITHAPGKGKHGSLWLIRESHNENQCETGAPIQCNSAIRLTHVQTLRNLHTHAITSPLSRQQEVSGFGEDGVGDTGDDWVVRCESSSAKYLERDVPFRLQHADTEKYLGGSSTVKFNAQNCGRNCPIMNHLEVFGRSKADKYTDFKIQLGVHLSK